MLEKLPEEFELDKKRKLLGWLSERLINFEQQMAELRGEIERFEARYAMEVARLYAEFDEIEAEIAEEELKLVPDDEEIKKRVEELRRRAEESAARAEAALEAENKTPTAESRKTYHQLARSIHPDLTLDEDEKKRRHLLMAELNKAFTSGDESALQRMAEEIRISPEAVQGDKPSDQLIKAIRQIYQIRRRFRELEEEKNKIYASETFTLYQQSLEAQTEGRDILREMAARTKTHIAKARRRLENLRQVTAAQEIHVKETYGMDIEEFRQKS
ncbi:MAG TPA: hypothetical protein VNK26_06795 [Pyrinomonadaceae bacterium]|jgi:hypothetical protein|nr:hypothetical protein [Pyrinomonadaceae bacterium]